MVKRKIDKVIDGDTFRVKTKINGSNFVRLSNVNAPELNARGGKTAKEQLRRELGNKPVNINPVGRSYNRVVADVKNGRKGVNRSMRKRGY